jgi:predicted nucleic acid-binding protein
VATDSHHAWAVDQLRHSPATVLTCDAVISEALFLLKREGHDCNDLFALATAGFLHSDFRFATDHAAIRKLMRRYANLPMSFADACLVRMAELRSGAIVWTLDRDFRVYRQHGRQTIPLVTPE